MVISIPTFLSCIRASSIVTSKRDMNFTTTGHFIEAAIAYYEVTGKDKFLNIMKKNADLICEVFHTEKYKNAVPGHEEIELALMKLADVHGDDKYSNMAKVL